MNRVVVLVDGFNLYYSICDAVNDTGASLKWLDLKGLCESLLAVRDMGRVPWNGRPRCSWQVSKKSQRCRRQAQRLKRARRCCGMWS